MRTATRNKQTVYYSILSDDEMIETVDGLFTGEYGKSYEDIESNLFSVGAAQGTLNTAIFGSNVQYDKTIVSDNMSLPFSDDDGKKWVFWIGKKPDDPTVPGVFTHNYQVTRITRSINFIAIAASRVDVQ